MTDSNFVYDEEVFKALTGRVPDTWQQCTTNKSVDTVSKVQCFGDNSIRDCSELEISPLVYNSIETFERTVETIKDNCERTVDKIIVHSETLSSPSQFTQTTSV